MADVPALPFVQQALSSTAAQRNGGYLSKLCLFHISFFGFVYSFSLDSLVLHATCWYLLVPVVILVLLVLFRRPCFMCLVWKKFTTLHLSCHEFILVNMPTYFWLNSHGMVGLLGRITAAQLDGDNACLR